MIKEGEKKGRNSQILKMKTRKRIKAKSERGTMDKGQKSRRIKKEETKDRNGNKNKEKKTLTKNRRKQKSGMEVKTYRRKH